MATATKALATLKREGLIRPVPGAGSVVVGREAAPARPSRPEAGLSKAAVVRAAVAVADAEGLQAVSMRRIATELGTSAMALYRHVPAKEHLLQEMAEQVMGELGLPTPGAHGWRGKLEALARLQWSGYQAHAWLAEAFSSSFTRPAPLPRSMAHTEWVLAAIEDQPLSPTERLHVAVSLFGYVQGTALKLVSEVEAQTESGLTSDEWLQATQPTMEQVLASGRFPAMARLLTHPDLDLDLESLFDFGLRRLLDGYAALFERRSRSRRRA
jgi:AcrR family transcriptional regulator